MTEFASLVISVDSRQAVTAARDLDALEQSGGQAEKATDALALAARRLASALAGIFAAGKVAEVTKLAARYNELGVVMDTVGANAGNSKEELAAQEMQLRKTGISMIESRANIAKMVQANIDLARATDLARLAQDAAVIGNMNSSDAFATLIHGIQSAQTDVLRTIGINVNFDDSYRQLARTLGKTTDELSENEKMQARVNAVLGQAPAIAGAYEAAMGNAGKQLRSASRYLEDFEVKLGQATQVPFATAVEAYADVLKFLGDNVEDVVQVLETGLYVAVGRGVAVSGTYVIQLARQVAAHREAAIAATEQAMAERALAAAQAQSGMISQAAAAERIAAANATMAANARAAAGGMGMLAAGGSRLLGLMGGPVGLAVSLGAVGLSLMDFTPRASDATQSAGDFADEVARLTGNVKELAAQKADKDLEAIETKIKGITQAITDRIREANQSGGMGNADRQYVQEMQLRLATLGQAWQDLSKKKQAALDANKAECSKEVETVSEKVENDYKRRLNMLSEQIRTYGEVGEAAKVRYETEEGELKKLSAAEKAALLEKARLLDDLRNRDRERNARLNFSGELDRLRQDLQLETDTIQQAYFQRQAMLERALAQKYMTESEYAVASTRLAIMTEGQMTEAAAREHQLRLQISEQFMNAAMTLAQNLQEFMVSIGHENSAIARAAFAVQKGIAVAMAFIQAESAAIATQVSYAQLAAMTGQIELIEVGAARAMAVRAMGYASAALMAGTAIAEATGAGRALGGPVLAGRTYVVGERGPELLTMGGNGHVTSNDSLKGMGGGSVTIINQTSGRIDHVEERRTSTGERLLILKEAVDAVAAAAADPNSKVSRAMQSAFGLSRNR